MEKLIEKAYELLGAITSKDQCIVVALTDGVRVSTIGAGYNEVQLRAIAELVADLVGNIARATEDSKESQNEIFAKIVTEIMEQAAYSFANDQRTTNNAEAHEEA